MSQEQQQRRSNLDAAKRQLVFIVSILATLFLLCPERLKVYRNLCIIPILAWLTAMSFDLFISLSEAWDNAPKWVKYFAPLSFPEITPPLDPIYASLSRWAVNSGIQFREPASKMKHRIACFKESILLALVNWLLCQMGQGPLHGISSGSEHEAAHRQREPDMWVGMLVATPPIHDYGQYSDSPETRKRPHETISWDNFDVSSIPALSPSSTFQAHLTLCFIARDIWSSSSKTIMEKFKTGVFWDCRLSHTGGKGCQWDEETIQTISSVQVIGSMEEHIDLNIVNECCESLLEDWEYIKLSWNDVDFAIILGFLAVGPSSAEICKPIFHNFAILRSEQVLLTRSKATNKAFFTSAFLSVEVTCLNFLFRALADPGAINSAMTASAGTDAFWEERIRACKKLLDRHEQLTAIFN